MEQVNKHPVSLEPRPFTSEPAAQPSLAGRSAFTLIELLVVLAIMVLVMSFIGPAVTSLLQSSNLATAGQMVADQFKLARQISSSSNRTVRIYFMTVPPLAGTNPGYNAIQLWSAVPVPLTGTTSSTTAPVNFIPAGKLVTLPIGVAVSQSQNSAPASSSGSKVPGLSTLFFQCSPWSSGNNPPLIGPNGGASVPYVAIDVKPSGQIVPFYPAGNPPPAVGMYAMYVTVVPTQFAGIVGASTTPPPNYATIQVNPRSGSTLIYRP